MTMRSHWTQMIHWAKSRIAGDQQVISSYQAPSPKTNTNKHLFHTWAKHWAPYNETLSQNKGRRVRAAYWRYPQESIKEDRGCSVSHSTDRAAASIPSNIHLVVILMPKPSPKQVVKELWTYKCWKTTTTIIPETTATGVEGTQFVFQQVPQCSKHWKRHWDSWMTRVVLASLTYFKEQFPKTRRVDLFDVARLINTQLEQGGPPTNIPRGTSFNTFLMMLHSPSLSLTLERNELSFMSCAHAAWLPAKIYRLAGWKT